MVRQKDFESSGVSSLLSPLHATESHSSLALNNRRNREIARYKRIAINESSPAKGGFLYAFLVAFKRADDGNALILLSAMRKLCQKYSLQEGET
jgi:hypothetical protein